MHTSMSQVTRQEVPTPLRRRYQRAGRTYKAQLLDQLVELFGYHRKAAVRMMLMTSGYNPAMSRRAAVSSR